MEIRNLRAVLNSYNKKLRHFVKSGGVFLCFVIFLIEFELASRRRCALLDDLQSLGHRAKHFSVSSRC